MTTLDKISVASSWLMKPLVLCCRAYFCRVLCEITHLGPTSDATQPCKVDGSTANGWEGENCVLLLEANLFFVSLSHALSRFFFFLLVS